MFYSWGNKILDLNEQKQEEFIIQKGFIIKCCVLYSLQMNIEMSVENKKEMVFLVFLYGL